MEVGKKDDPQSIPVNIFHLLKALEAQFTTSTRCHRFVIRRRPISTNMRSCSDVADSSKFIRHFQPICGVAGSLKFTRNFRPTATSQRRCSFVEIYS